MAEALAASGGARAHSLPDGRPCARRAVAAGSAIASRVRRRRRAGGRPRARARVGRALPARRRGARAAAAPRPHARSPRAARRRVARLLDAPGGPGVRGVARRAPRRSAARRDEGPARALSARGRATPPHARPAAQAQCVLARTMRDALAEALVARARRRLDRRGRPRRRGTVLLQRRRPRRVRQLPDPATAHAVRSARSPRRLLSLCGSRAARGGARRLRRRRLSSSPRSAGMCAPARTRTSELPELGMGLVPGAGGTVSLPRRIGRQRTAWLALSGAASTPRRRCAGGSWTRSRAERASPRRSAAAPGAQSEERSAT